MKKSQIQNNTILKFSDGVQKLEIGEKLADGAHSVVFVLNAQNSKLKSMKKSKRNTIIKFYYDEDYQELEVLKKVQQESKLFFHDN